LVSELEVVNWRELLGIEVDPVLVHGGTLGREGTLECLGYGALGALNIEKVYLLFCIFIGIFKT
jgi:hypothetical protein